MVERVGVDAVALVTGEEKIKPREPRFWVATVEAMPRDLDVDLLCRRRDSDRRRSRSRPCLYRSAAQPARQCRDLDHRRRHHAAPGGKPAARRGHGDAAQAVEIVVRRREEDEPPAAALGHRRVLGRGSLRHRRTIRRQQGGAAVVLAPCRRAPATPRWRSTSPARWTIWWRPTRSAWASTWMSITWPSRGPQVRRFGFRRLTPAESARSPAGPAAICATGARHEGPLPALRAGARASARRSRVRSRAASEMAQSGSRLCVARIARRKPVADAELARPDARSYCRRRGGAGGRFGDADMGARRNASNMSNSSGSLPGPRLSQVSPAAHAELVTTLYGRRSAMASGDDWFYSSRAGRSRRRRHRYVVGADRVGATWTFVAIVRTGWPIPSIGRPSSPDRGQAVGHLTSVWPAASSICGPAF